MTREQRKTVRSAIRFYRVAELQNNRHQMNAFRRAVHDYLVAYRRAS